MMQTLKKEQTRHIPLTHLRRTKKRISTRCPRNSQHAEGTIYLITQTHQQNEHKGRISF